MTPPTAPTSRPVARTCALVGPGRAGTAIAASLVAIGWTITRVAGRAPDGASVSQTAQRFGAEPVAVADVGRGARLVVIATPDGVVSDTASEVAAGLDPQALVVHLSGSLGLDALAPIAAARDDVDLGALHPLQTLTSGDAGAARLTGSWCAVAGPPAVTAVAEELGLRPFAVEDDRRATYHAAASIASNHLVALVGQVERVAADAGVPLEAFEPLVRATIDNVFALGPARALTGPVARGDLATVLRHLEVVAADEQRAYRALADAAARLAGRDDATLRSALS
ncbi:MAG: Rossmann-like and DUF2520 domain-containing protein [Acidimicrobiia bacterium]